LGQVKVTWFAAITAHVHAHYARITSPGYRLLYFCKAEQHCNTHI